MSPVGPHLTAEDLDRLVTGTGAVAAGVRRHLEDCAECRRRHALHLEMEQMLTGTNAEHAADVACPPVGQWAYLAAGVLRPEETAALHRHAAVCPACARQRDERAAEVAPQLSPAEQQILAGLASSHDEWQAQLTRRLMQQAATAPPPGGDAAGFASDRGSAKPWLRAAVLLLACAAAGLWWGQHRTASTATLLARAYGQQRTLQLRFPGVLYGPLRQQRGAADVSSLERSPDLLAAEARLAAALHAAPDDPALLDAKARADLLEWHADAALASLQRALAVAPDNAVYKTDLAVAYFERAEMGAAQDYGAAAQALGEVLAGHPDDGVARFNRAIVYERLTLYGEAVADWQEYLRGDPHGPWADEARVHLQDDEKSLAQPAGPAAAVTPDAAPWAASPTPRRLSPPPCSNGCRRLRHPPRPAPRRRRERCKPWLPKWRSLTTTAGCRTSSPRPRCGARRPASRSWWGRCAATSGGIPPGRSPRDGAPP